MCSPIGAIPAQTLILAKGEGESTVM